MSAFEEEAPTGMLLQQNLELALAFSYCTMGNSWKVCFHGNKRGLITVPPRYPELKNLHFSPNLYKSCRLYSTVNNYYLTGVAPYTVNNQHA